MPRNEYAFSLADYRAAIRRGPYTWPGCYARTFITSDGAELCYACAEKERTSIVWSIANECDDGWRIVAESSADVCENAEQCAHCNAYLNDYFSELTPVLLPEHWEYAMEYGTGEDGSLTPEEVAAIEALPAKYGRHECTTGEPFFTWHHDGGSYGATVRVFWFRPEAQEANA